MSLTGLIKKIVDPNHASNSAYIEYLRSHGVHIGDNTIIYAPRHTSIDVQKPHLISIGKNCKITSGVHILAHDYSIDVPRQVFGEFIGGTAPVTIGDNCFIGVNAVIMKGTNIGNNCIVGAGSIVSGGVYPDGSIIAGNPARVISTVEKFFQKNKNDWVSDAKACAKAIYQNTGRKPTIDEMRDGFYWLYTPRTEENIHNYEYFFTLSGDDYESVCSDFMKSRPIYGSFEEFLEDCDFE